MDPANRPNPRRPCPPRSRQQRLGRPSSIGTRPRTRGPCPPASRGGRQVHERDRVTDRIRPCSADVEPPVVAYQARADFGQADSKRSRAQVERVPPPEGVLRPLALPLGARRMPDSTRRLVRAREPAHFTARCAAVRSTGSPRTRADPSPVHQAAQLRPPLRVAGSPAASPEMGHHDSSLDPRLAGSGSRSGPSRRELISTGLDTGELAARRRARSPSP
jgi:hypothetical protein